MPLPTENEIKSQQIPQTDNINQAMQSTVPLDVDMLGADLAARLQWPSQTFPVKFYGVNLLEMVALKFRQKTFGKMVEVTSDDTKIQKMIDDYFDFDIYNFLLENELIVSIWGASIIFIDYNRNKLRWTTANPWNLSIYQFDEKPTYTDLTILRDSGVYQKIRYSPTTIEVKWVIGGAQLKAEELQAYIELNNLHDYTKTHNFNQMPIYYFLNKPKYKNYGTSLSQRYPDMMNCLGYQTIINQLIQTAYYELQMGKTQSSASLTPQQLADLNKKPADQIKFFTSPLTAILPNSKMDFVAGQTNQIKEVIQSRSTFNDHLMAVDEVIKLTFKAVGLSVEDNRDGVQRTMMEVDYQTQPDSEIIALRKAFRKKQIKELVKRSLLIIDGTLNPKELDEKILVELKTNLGIDAKRRLDEADQRMTMGLMSRKQALQLVDDKTDQEAEVWLSEVGDEGAVNSETETDENQAREEE